MPVELIDIMQHTMFLGHFNPLTNSHAEIFRHRIQEGEIYIFPVSFRKNSKEVNTSHLPFPYEVRREMINSIFKDKVHVFDTYAFNAPYLSYFKEGVPSDKGYELRDKILSQVPEPKKAFTGDKNEYDLLVRFGFDAELGKRLPESASRVRELLYKEAIGSKLEEDWRSLIPPSVVDIINREWETVKYFAEVKMKDTFVTSGGLKVPVKGLLA